MLGGIGDDTYIVNVSTDVVTENANEGLDTVQSIVTWTLGSNLENLTLAGASAINGTGNAANNLLTGNSAANTLSGAAGDDIYLGGAGNDTLTDISTSSNDVYRWGVGQGSDTLTDAGGTADRIELSAGISSNQVSLTRSGNNLRIGVAGTAETLTVVNWYANAANRIEQIVLADGTSIPGSAVPASALASNLRMGADSTGEDVIAMAMRSSWGRMLDARTDLLIEAMAVFDAQRGIGASSPIGRTASIHPVLAASSI